jgi:hypothetical protein
MSNRMSRAYSLAIFVGVVLVLSIGLILSVSSQAAALGF